MQRLVVGLLTLVTAWASAAGEGQEGTGAAWCAEPLGDLFPGRPVWLGAPLPPSAGKLRPVRVNVQGSVEGSVGLLDGLPGGADRPAGNVRRGRSDPLLVSSRGRTALFVQRDQDGRFRAFRWPAGPAPGAVTVTLTPGGVHLSVPAVPLPCRATRP